MEKSKVTALINVYTRKSITIAVAFIALFCLSGCWNSLTDLIPDRDAVNPFESAKYILFRTVNPEYRDDPYMLLQRRSGEHEIFILSDPSFTLTTTKFYNIGGYFEPKKYIVGLGDDKPWRYWYVTENKVYGPEGMPFVRSISEIKKSINSGIKLNFIGELRAISSIQSAQLRQEMINHAARVFRDPLKDGGYGPTMVVLPTGSFRMGSPSGEEGRYSDEGPVRTVTIGKRIAMGRYEVTFADYDRFVAATNGRRPDDEGWGRGSRPVINVNWNEAKAYATWLSAQTGKSYRLPSESEWEYAARAGTETAYSWGNEIGVNRANCDGCGSQWDDEQTSPVGSFEPNAFGLYDMHGNVYEWVEDCYVNTYTGAPSDGSARTSGCGSDVFWAVVRGGSWFVYPQYLRSASRYGDAPSDPF